MKLIPCVMLVSSIMAKWKDPEYDATYKDPRKDLTFEKDNLLKDCSLWFDGCNTCSVIDGKIARCTRQWCRRKKEAYCKTFVLTADNLDENTEKKDSGATLPIHGSQCGWPFKEDYNVDKTAISKCKIYETIDNCIKYQLDETQVFPPKILSCEKKANCVYAKQSPKCTTKYTDNEVEAAKTATVTKTVDLTKCLTWWDGCNECPVYSGVK